VNGSAQEIMLVRHPQTEMNAAGRYIGRSDSPWTEEGHQQVAWLAGVVANWQPETIFSSPLGRALETACAVAPSGITVTTLEDLQEIDFGQAEGHTYAELAELGIRLDYTSGGAVAPGGEHGKDFLTRIGGVASHIAQDGSRAVVLTHGGVLRHLLVTWLGLPMTSAWRFAVPNAGIAVLRLADDAGVLEGLVSPSLHLLAP
jgi:broad specificity phosphatase PhoE